MSPEERIRQDIAQRLEADIERAFYGAMNTTTIAAPEKPLNVKDMLHQCERVMREVRRNQITFRADLAHGGPMLKIETPNDGAVIELSFAQAQQVHKHWPLKLHKVLDRFTAEFVPATSWDRVVPVNLPLPPFEMNEDEGDNG
ncbi:MAG: hypothetical protein E5W57_04115 [Mesorhizobium sp.]|nr:MAG: hypothetical protein E5W57_04115 [Mesorhizobium sp.]